MVWMRASYFEVSHYPFTPLHQCPYSPLLYTFPLVSQGEFVEQSKHMLAIICFILITLMNEPEVKL